MRLVGHGNGPVGLGHPAPHPIRFPAASACPAHCGRTGRRRQTAFAVASRAARRPPRSFGAIGDRLGRRRIMLIGLVLLGVASLAPAFVTTAEQLIAVRVVIGVAAAMTTPGSMALSFRLFAEDAALPPDRNLCTIKTVYTVLQRCRHQAGQRCRGRTTWRMATIACVQQQLQLGALAPSCLAAVPQPLECQELRNLRQHGHLLPDGKYSGELR